MAVFNHAKREINAKIVLYGPPDCGKGALFRSVHQRIKPSLCGPLKSMATGGDTLLFFDYVPFESSSLDGYRVCFHLYTLTGRVENAGTWKMLLKGVDGIVVIPESGCRGDGTQAPLLSGLRSMMNGYGKDIDALPVVVLATEAHGADGVAAELPNASVVAVPDMQGDGAVSALAELSRQIMQALRRQYEAQQQSLMVSIPDHNTFDAGQEDELLMAGVRLPAASLSPSVPVSVKIPVAVTVEGRECRYILSATLVLEPEEAA